MLNESASGMPESMRVNRYLAVCGVCSRREADRLIEAGRVKIDGRTAKPGDRVSSGMSVKLDGRAVVAQTGRVVYAYYKPRGVVCTERDAHAERTIASELAGREELRLYGKSTVACFGAPDAEMPSVRRLLYVGRLDRDSEGLLLLTNDGALKRRLESAESGVEKEYLVTVDRRLTEEARRRLEAGIWLEELQLKTRPCRIFRSERPNDVESGAVDFVGEERGRKFHIVLTEGKNRQIRRMCGTEGLVVTRLVRVREGNVTLGDMCPGELRRLTESEEACLYQSGGDIDTALVCS